MKIGIITPMETEKRYLNNLFNETDGQINNHQIVLMESGIGKVNSAIAVTQLVDLEHVDLIINTGSAGALSSDLQIGDEVVADSLKYFDAFNTVFNYELGQIPQEQISFDPKKKYVDLIKKSSPDIKAGLIVSGDSFVEETLRPQIKKNFPTAIAAEMEGAAVAHAATKLGVDFVVIRAISDNADGNADTDFDKFVVQAGENSGKLVEKFIQSL
jgi:adenosylhomocysteine nucleosidase